MKDNKYMMESLDQFVSEDHAGKPNVSIDDNDRIESIVKEFGIDPEELYYPSLKDAIYNMASEIYSQRGHKYLRSGWVNPN